MKQGIILVAVALAVTACTDKDSASGAPATGPNGSSGSSSSAGSGGTTAGSGGTTAGSGGTTAGSGGTTAGSAGTGGTTAGSGGSGADAEAARRACVPDCFWNVVAPCRPDAECTFQDGAGDTWLECTEDGSWTREYDPAQHFRTVVKKNGEVCYQVKVFDENRLDVYDKDNKIHAMLRMGSGGPDHIACDDTGGEWVEFKLNAPGCEEYRQRDCTPGTCE